MCASVRSIFHCGKNGQKRGARRDVNFRLLFTSKIVEYLRVDDVQKRKGQKINFAACSGKYEFVKVAIHLVSYADGIEFEQKLLVWLSYLFV